MSSSRWAVAIVVPYTQANAMWTGNSTTQLVRRVEVVRPIVDEIDRRVQALMAELLSDTRD